MTILQAHTAHMLSSTLGADVEELSTCFCPDAHAIDKRAAQRNAIIELVRRRSAGRSEKALRLITDYYVRLAFELDGLAVDVDELIGTEWLVGFLDPVACSCGKVPSSFNTCSEDGIVHGVSCRCGRTTAYYETQVEAHDAWNLSVYASGHSATEPNKESK